MEKRFEQIQKNPFQPPVFDDLLRPFDPPQGPWGPKHFQAPQRFGLPGDRFGFPKDLADLKKEAFEIPKFEFPTTAPDRFERSSRYSTGSTWMRKNGKFQYREQIRGLDVGLKGAASGSKLDIESIEIETGSGKKSTFGSVEDVPHPYRDEVQSAIEKAQRNVQ